MTPIIRCRNTSSAISLSLPLARSLPPSGVQPNHERQAAEPRVQRHHVGVSLPRTGRSGVSVLPGVVRPEALPAHRGTYLTATQHNPPSL